MKNPILSDILLDVCTDVYVQFIKLPFIFTNSASVITPWSFSFASLANSSAIEVTYKLNRILLVPWVSTVSDCA